MRTSLCLIYPKELISSWATGGLNAGSWRRERSLEIRLNISNSPRAPMHPMAFSIAANSCQLLTLLMKLRRMSAKLY